MSLRNLEKMLEKDLQKKVLEGMAKTFDQLSCKGVANEIRHGRNVHGNIEYGIRHCVHPRLGPTVNVETGKFTPQSAKKRAMEERFIELANKALKTANLPTVKSTLLADLRKGDKEFERKVKSRHG